MVRVALLMLVVSACGPKAAPGDPTPVARDGGGEVAVTPVDAAVPVAPDAPLALEDDMPELARRSADMLVALGDALAQTGDCKALAAAATAVLTEHREVRVAAATAADRGRGPDLDAALEAHAARIAEAAKRMQPALTQCAGDAAFAEALTPFDVP